VKILLIGYGKMGQIIEKLALEKGHTIVGKYDSRNPFNKENYVDADVAIEFSHPELAMNHIKTAIELKLPMVVGTTGWYNEFDEMSQLCIQHNSAIFTATNFSLGVNLFFEMAKRFTRLLNHYDYQASINEIHHLQKKDAPSGTAITLAEHVIANSEHYNNWTLDETNLMDQTMNSDSLPITAQRLPNVPGTHTLKFENNIDIIRLEHEAKNRIGFAAGALLASEWIIGKTGVFGMSDLLNFEN
jgi:4-hydroxy-tetrahydrodipicolinate reductase